MQILPRVIFLSVLAAAISSCSTPNGLNEQEEETLKQYMISNGQSATNNQAPCSSARCIRNAERRAEDRRDAKRRHREVLKSVDRELERRNRVAEERRLEEERWRVRILLNSSKKGSTSQNGSTPIEGCVDDADNAGLCECIAKSRAGVRDENGRKISCAKSK